MTIDLKSLKRASEAAREAFAKEERFKLQPSPKQLSRLIAKTFKRKVREPEAA